MDNKLPTLTVIMPCLNEEDNIAAAAHATLAAFEYYGINGQLVIVNDGSLDRTEEIACGLQQRDNRIKLINHPNSQGIGASFWDGVKHASGDFCTWIPGDNENVPEDVLRFFYMANDVDIVVPFICNAEVRSLSRRFISALFRLIVNISFGTNLNYTNGTVIYNTAILRDIELKTTGFFYQAEILIRLIRAGYLYAEVPQFLNSRAAGKTKALTLKSFIEVTKGYLRMVWEVHAMRRVNELGDDLNPKSASYRRIREYAAKALASSYS